MGAFIFKQPNGLYGRFSSIVDCPTHINLTREDVIELYAEKAREEARRMFENDDVCSFDAMMEMCEPTNNLSYEEWFDIHQAMYKPTSSRDFEPYSIEIYPLTVVMDRYDGTYSGAVYTAWNLDFWNIPAAIDGADYECRAFWASDSKNYLIGKGDTIMDAVKDLREKIEALREEKGREKEETK